MSFKLFFYVGCSTFFNANSSLKGLHCHKPNTGRWNHNLCNFCGRNTLVKTARQKSWRNLRLAHRRLRHAVMPYTALYLLHSSTLLIHTMLGVPFGEAGGAPGLGCWYGPQLPGLVKGNFFRQLSENYAS